MTDTLRVRVKTAFARDLNVPWPDDPSLAIALGGAAVQCQTEHKAGFVCDVVKETARNTRNAKLMVYMLQCVGWPEPECDQWIGTTLRTAITAKKPTMRRKVYGNLTIDLICSKTPALITLAIEEHV